MPQLWKSSSKTVRKSLPLFGPCSCVISKWSRFLVEPKNKSFYALENCDALTTQKVNGESLAALESGP
jgi:hypothetical protein